MNVLDAAYRLAHDYPGGVESLAPRIGKNPTTLNHELVARNGAKLGLVTAHDMTALTGNWQILNAFALSVGALVIPLQVGPDQAADDCMLALAKTARGFAALIGDVGEALADGRVSDNELDHVERECGEMMASLQVLMAKLRARNEQGKPSLKSVKAA